MKKIYVLMVMAFCLASCSKQVPESTGEMIFKMEDDSFEASVDTKATALTAVPSSINWLATDGTAGTSSEAQVYGSRSVSSTAGVFHTDCWWPSTSKAYTFYASNLAMTFTAGTGATVQATNTTDVVVGSAAAPYKSEPAIALHHIFARTASLSLNVVAGYTASNVTWKIKSNAGSGGTAGKYNLNTGTWSGMTALAEQTFTSSSDLYLVPGSYTVTVTFTLTKGDYSKEFTQSGTVTLVAGSRNSISATTSLDPAVQIVLSVSLNAWGTNSATVSTLS